MGSSASGTEAIISTRSPLLAADRDEVNDLYRVTSGGRRTLISGWKEYRRSGEASRTYLLANSPHMSRLLVETDGSSSRAHRDETQDNNPAIYGRPRLVSAPSK